MWNDSNLAETEPVINFLDKMIEPKLKQIGTVLGAACGVFENRK